MVLRKHASQAGKMVVLAVVILALVLSMISTAVAEQMTLYATGDTFKDPDNPSMTNGSETGMLAGKNSTSDHYWAFINFSIGSLPNANECVLNSATFYVRCFFTTADAWIGVCHAEGSWSESTLTNNNRPPRSNTQYDDVAAAAGWRTADVTEFIRRVWINGNSNYGLVLGPSKTNTCPAGEFTTWYTKESGNAPYIVVNYTRKPSSPTSLNAVAVSDSQINLSWTDNSSNESGFRIYRSLSASSGYSLEHTNSANDTTWSNTGLSASTTYHYRVYSYNTTGNSTSYAYDSVTTDAPPLNPPDSPTNLVATAVSSNQINLSWQDNSTNETGFKIERKTGSSGTYSQIATVGANMESYSNTGLSSDTTYYYRIRAYNGDGNSGYSNEDSDTTFSSITIPNSPSNLIANPVSSSQVSLQWTDNSNDEDGFRVYRSSSSSVKGSLIYTTVANVTSYTNSGLTAGTTYYYRVYAYNTAGESSGYASDNAATPPITSTPNSPSNLVLTVVSNNQIDLEWVDNSNNEDGFRIYRSSSSSIKGALLNTVAPNDTTYSNFGLSAGTTYHYRVYAYNSAGESTGYASSAAATPTEPVVIVAKKKNRCGVGATAPTSSDIFGWFLPFALIMLVVYVSTHRRKGTERT